MTIPALNLLLDDLEDSGKIADPIALFEAFEAWASETKRPLYPHQSEAGMQIMVGENHVIAATPTGSGKSMIALAGHLTALARGVTSYYTAPLKALVSEKFFDLVELFGAANVGMVTGDVSLNPRAPIICCTAEILANQALRSGADLDVGLVVMDEFHYYGDPQRGWAWQAPLLLLPHTQFVLLSATLGDVSFFVKDLTARTGRNVALIDQAKRPVPLEFDYILESLPVALERLIGTNKSPTYVVFPSQRLAVSGAGDLQISIKISKEQAAKITDLIGDFRFGPGFGKVLSASLRKGVGIHHAGMLPKYRRLVEKLAQSGVLPVICGTDTLGVGINVPIRSVLFTSLVKFDGSIERHLLSREFHQLAGRAGRAGFDTVGYVEVQAPGHVIENAKALEKAGDDEKKRRKIVRKKAPEGRVNWTDKTFEKLLHTNPEPLASTWNINHAMVLNTLARPGDKIANLSALVTDNHVVARGANPEAIAQNYWLCLAQILVSLVQSEILLGAPENIDFTPEVFSGEGTPGQDSSQAKDWVLAGSWRLSDQVPANFALNSDLAPFALSAIEVLDPWEPPALVLTPGQDSGENREYDRENAKAKKTVRPDYELDIVSLVEAICDDPRPILFAQQRQAKDQLISQLKAEGVEYEERMRLAQEVTWPQPLNELIGALFAIYIKTNPWAQGSEPSAKSIVRFMIENAASFSEFISRFGIETSEGVLLRYLTEVWRNLRQVVPENARSNRLEEITEWLGNLVHYVDSSLADEWQRIEQLQSVLDPFSNGQDDLSSTHNPRSTKVNEQVSLVPEISDDCPQISSGDLAFGQRADGYLDFRVNPAALIRLGRNLAFSFVQAAALDRPKQLASLQEKACAGGSWPKNLARKDEAYFDKQLEAYWQEYEWIDTSGQARSQEYYSFETEIDAQTLEIVTGLKLDLAADSRYAFIQQTIVDDQNDLAWKLYFLVDLDASEAKGDICAHVLAFKDHD